MVARTSNSRSAAPALTRAGNPRAVASALIGAVGVAVVPLGVVASRYLDQVDLLPATGSAVPAALLGLAAIVLSRRGRETIQRTLGRSGGQRAAGAGAALGVLALWISATTALAVGFYGLLTLFAD